jgi:DNA-binding NtrC family response regulator
MDVEDSASPETGGPYPIDAAFHGMVGRSAAMQTVFRKIERYGAVHAPVLITGETGTGKELIARAVHRVSPRRGHAFVALNCSALNDDLFESELFGHERGAFTGAVSTHKGRFERASLGSLFLDEIGEMPERVQAKLLRVLEHGTFERVGGEREMASDVRVIAATNVGLERAVREGGFRADLYHRVAVLRIHAPALRERLADLPYLVSHFMRMFAQRYGRPAVRLSPEAASALDNYVWPGNIRELRNVLERLFVESDGDVIGRGALAEWERERGVLVAGGWNVDLRDQERVGGSRVLVPNAGDVSPEDVRQAAVVIARALTQSVGQGRDDARPHGRPHGGHEAGPPVRRIESLPEGIDAERPIVNVEAEIRGAEADPVDVTEASLREAFRAARGNLTEVARRLGVHKATIYRHMKRLGIERDDLTSD